MPNDVEIAGVRCSEVLADLSSYLEGALDPSEVQALEQHLAGCPHCAQFGQDFAGVLQQMHRHLRVDTPMDDGIADRLTARLQRSETEHS